jgi:hypothetical protein
MASPGYSQYPGIDYDETYNPFVKPTIICLVLHIYLQLLAN